MTTKKALVTGGAGFIGTHLCERLLAEEYEVFCVDNLITGKIKNLDRFMKQKNFHFIEHDVTEPIELECDEIYNLACPASPKHYQKDPVKTLMTNIQGAFHLLNLADKTGAKILQASTSEVYGDPIIHPQSEEYWGNVNPIGVRACYDEGKRAAETLFMDYHRQRDLEIKIVRIFNTYGPVMSQGDGRVMTNFIMQALNGQALTIYGDGSQTRSFCHVNDLVEAIRKMMDTNHDVTGPFNIGNPNEITILELAKKIIGLTQSQSEICFLDLPQDDPTKRKPDIRTAKKGLGWEPKIDLEEGLKGMIEYYKNSI